MESSPDLEGSVLPQEEEGRCRRETPVGGREPHTMPGGMSPKVPLFHACCNGWQEAAIVYQGHPLDVQAQGPSQAAHLGYQGHITHKVREGCQSALAAKDMVQCPVTSCSGGSCHAS